MQETAFVLSDALPGLDQGALTLVADPRAPLAARELLL